MENTNKKTLIQIVLFTFLSIVAFLVQLLINTFLPKLLNLFSVFTGNINAGIFGVQQLSVFISFLIGNVVAKLISYLLNRKKTFKATNNLAISITLYVIMCVSLIIIETLIGAPLADLFNKVISNAELCRTLSTITYSFADFIIVFLLEKFVIMK